MFVKAKKIVLLLKIKSVFLNIEEAESVTVIWRRGTRDLESKSGKVDLETHLAKIDEIFKMKTSLDFDDAES